MLFKKNLLIRAPIRNVWSYIDDIEKQKQWMTNIVDRDEEDIDDDTCNIYIKEGNYVNTYIEKILYIDPPYRLHILMVDKKRNIEIYMDFKLFKEGNYTALEYVGEKIIHSLQMKIMTKMLGGFFSTIAMNKFFKDMKSFAEASYIK